MNIETAKKIAIRNVLESFSLFPSKENSKTAFYYAVDREEKTPSLSVNFMKQTAFDFGTGKMYDTISLVQAIRQCSVSEALQYLSHFDFVPQKIENKTVDDNKYEILEIKDVQHFVLKQYMKERKLLEQREHLKEIHYQLNDKKYFGLAFKNDSGGFEVRNKYVKICLGEKDITTVNNNGNEVSIFESWSDYLSFLRLKNILQIEPSDYIILNSNSMIFRLKDKLNGYKVIRCFTDNDQSGSDAINNMKKFHNAVIDERILFKDFKDSNEFIKHK